MTKPNVRKSEQLVQEQLEISPLSSRRTRFVPGGGLREARGPRPSGPAPGGVHPRRPEREAEGEGAPPGGCDRHPEELPVPGRGRSPDQGAVSVLGVGSGYVRCSGERGEATLHACVHVVTAPILCVLPSDESNESQRVKKYSAFIESLPKTNKLTLDALLQHLYRYTHTSDCVCMCVCVQVVSI